MQKEVKEKSTIQQSNIDVHRAELLSYTVCFVDGGILSNFPINVFHNPKIRIARMPTFGVKLEDEDHIVAGTNKTVWKRFLSFLRSILSTVRFYYDRDFLRRNEIYEKCIAHVDAAGFNWLNFGIDTKTKVELFKRGAETAKAFFLGGTVWIDGKEKLFEAYDWEKFKKERELWLRCNMENKKRGAGSTSFSYSHFLTRYYFLYCSFYLFCFIFCLFFRPR